MNPDEQVEHLDDSGAVVGLVSRAEMRRRNLLHRSVYIVVLDSTRTSLLAHRRADWKDVWPGRWDLAFGGVVDPGESWEDAAKRELAEEAGVDVDVVEVGAGIFEDDDVRCSARIHVAFHDGPFTHADDEVVETAWVSLAEIDRWMSGRQLCPDSLALALPLVRL